MKPNIRLLRRRSAGRSSLIRGLRELAPGALAALPLLALLLVPERTAFGATEPVSGLLPLAQPVAVGPAPPEEGAGCAVEHERVLPGGLHARFDRLLGAFVRDGVVDYGCFKVHEAELDLYLISLAEADPATLSKPDRLALWINAYNAFTIKLILDRYPEIESIKDIPRRWKLKRWVVGGLRYSLDEIEHEILRKRFEEPRIHFAIVCASISCPDLPSEAYVADRVDIQLDLAARRFLANPDKGFRTGFRRPESRERPEVHISSIFKWFKKDFERDGSVLDFIVPYVSAAGRAFVAEHGNRLKVRHLDYDWTLNGS